MEREMKQAWYMSWEESEAGWGTRPDGCSLHETSEHYRSYERAYWAKMPDVVPDEYCISAGELCQVSVSPTLYERIKDCSNRHGLSLSSEQERELIKSADLVYGDDMSGWIHKL